MEYLKKIVEYCKQKGFKYSVEGEWVRLARCPLCESTSRAPFSLNANTGAGKCHRCAWVGGLTQLRVRLGDLVNSVDTSKNNYAYPPEGLSESEHKALLANTKAMEYLQARGLTKEFIIKFRLGYGGKSLFGQNGIAFPYIEKGKVVSIKYKIPKKNGSKDYRRWKDLATGQKSKATLFKVDSLKGDETAIVCEGEEDCIILDQLGYENVVSIPNGCQSVNGPFLDPLEPFKEIIIIFDNDEAGRAGAEKLAASLGKERCRIATLPPGAKDPTEFMIAGREQDIREAIENAKGYQHEKVAHISEFMTDIIDEFINGARSPGVSFGLPRLDSILGGRRPREFTVVSGGTGDGKSTFCWNLALNWALNGEGVLFGSFEVDVKAAVRKLLQMITGKYYFAKQAGSMDSVMTLEELRKAGDIIATLPIFVINVFGTMDMEDFMSASAYAQRRLNTNIIFLDHLHFMLKPRRAEDMVLVIDEACNELKNFAMSNNVHNIAVCHPKFTKDRNNTGNDPVSGQDFKGSSSIQQIADNILVVWRDRNAANPDPRFGQSRVFVRKCRSEAGTEGEVPLIFHHASQRFYDDLSATPETLLKVIEKQPVITYDDSTLEGF